MNLVYTMWKLRKFLLPLFWQKFRESNVFTKEITKELIFEIVFIERDFLVFPHCAVQITVWKFGKNFVKVTFLLKNY